MTARTAVPRRTAAVHPCNPPVAAGMAIPVEALRPRTAPTEGD